MTTRIGTEGSVVGAILDLSMTTVAICILFVGQFVMHKNKVLCIVATMSAHIGQIQQVTTDTVPGGHDGDTVALGATDRKQVALGSPVTPIVAAETPWRIPVPGIVRK